MSLADRLIEARTRAGLNPAELAKRIGVKPSAIYQIEEGKSKSLKGPTLVNLAHELNVNPRWLMLGKGSIESQSMRVTPAIIAATQEVLALYLRFVNQPATLGRDPEMLAETLGLVLASDGDLSEKSRTELAIRLADRMRASGGRADEVNQRGDAG